MVDLVWMTASWNVELLMIVWRTADIMCLCVCFGLFLNLVCVCVHACMHM